MDVSILWSELVALEAVGFLPLVLAPKVRMIRSNVLNNRHRNKMLRIGTSTILAGMVQHFALWQRSP